MTTSQDDSTRLVDAVVCAVSDKSRIAIAGHSSKAHYVKPKIGDTLQTSDHVGIVEYQPDELTISVRSGTPIADVVAALDERGQMLAADPPQFLGAGTIGGAIACGLSGPGRPWYGNLRDAVLGIEIVNGLGEQLRFGGAVMKNVAGFDVSRLFVGSLGVFGLILTVNLRVQPKPEVTRSVALEADWDQACEVFRQSLGQPVPITGTCFFNDQLQLRLAGNATSIEETMSSFGAYREISNDIWLALRDHNHEFFQDTSHIKRVWLGRGAFPSHIDSALHLVEWAGAQIWFDRETSTDFDLINGASVESFGRTSAESAEEAKYITRLRDAFDPNRLFNADIRI